LHRFVHCILSTIHWWIKMNIIIITPYCVVLPAVIDRKPLQLSLRLWSSGPHIERITWTRHWHRFPLSYCFCSSYLSFYSVIWRNVDDKIDVYTSGTLLSIPEDIRLHNDADGKRDISAADSSWHGLMSLPVCVSRLQLRVVGMMMYLCSSVDSRYPAWHRQARTDSRWTGRTAVVGGGGK